MKTAKILAGVVAVTCIGASVASAYPIALSIFGQQGLFESDASTLLPAGAYYQVYWSADNVYGTDTTITEPDADLAAGNYASFGDYVLFTGTTPDDGGWSGPTTATGPLDPNLGGPAVSSGYVYVYVYQGGTADVGDSYLRSPIYGNTWTDASQDPTPLPDNVDIAPSSGNNMGSFFVVAVPEPATMALFGIGMLTVAIRRRRK